MGPSEPSYPVITVDDAFHACHPEIPLEPGDPRYVDLTPVRGGHYLATVITQCIQRTRLPMFHKQLVTGHRGSGKSTELKQLHANLRDQGYLAVYVDVEELLDLGDITYLDVLVAIAQAIAEHLRTEKIKLSPGLLKALDDWFAEVVLTKEQRQDVEGTLSAEFGVGSRVPLLRMLASVTGQIKSGSSRKVEIRRTLERELRVFIQRLNDLIADARIRLQKRGWSDLVVILDGLEKMHYARLENGKSTHSALFVDHSEQLKAPECHIIYTVPISLVFNVNLGDAFPDETIVIPMVKVTRDDGNAPYEDGREALLKVVAKRVDVDAVFTDRQCLERLVEVSGGSVRDLMRLVRLSCYGATDRITRAHVDEAVCSLVRDYDRLIRDEDVEGLQQVAQQRRVSNNETSAWLLHHRLILEYQNHHRWADPHPAVRLSPRLQAKLKE